MKLEIDMWHHLLDLYTKFQTDISKHVQKSPENFSLAGSSTNAPFSSVFVRQRAKNYPTMIKINRDQDTHNISVYQIWALCMIVKAMNSDKWLWPILSVK